jgi:hypothetical protein
MSRVKINRWKPPVVALYDPEGTYMGDVNLFEFGDIRLQIAKQKLIGYYVIWQTERYDIDSDGSGAYLEGFHDITLKQCIELRTIKLTQKEL